MLFIDRQAQIAAHALDYRGSGAFVLRLSSLAFPSLYVYVALPCYFFTRTASKETNEFVRNPFFIISVVFVYFLFGSVVLYAIIHILPRKKAFLETTALARRDRVLSMGPFHTTANRIRAATVESIQIYDASACEYLPERTLVGMKTDLRIRKSKLKRYR